MFPNGYTPTPQADVENLVAGLRAGQIHIELGSGDGRVVVAAAQLGARSTGFEIDRELVDKSARRIRTLGLDAAIVNADCLTADLREADLVTAYFIGELADAVISKFLREAKPGARLMMTDRPCLTR